MRGSEAARASSGQLELIRAILEERRVAGKARALSRSLNSAINDAELGRDYSIRGDFGRELQSEIMGGY